VRKTIITCDACHDKMTNVYEMTFQYPGNDAKKTIKKEYCYDCIQKIHIAINKELVNLEKSKEKS
jgi:hypothetical protein